MRGLLVVFLLATFAQAHAGEGVILANVTCKLYGPDLDWHYQTVAQTTAVLTQKQVDEAKREAGDGGCKDDEFYIPSASSKDDSVKISLVANVCGNSDVYWFARIESAALFPGFGQFNGAIDANKSNRMSLGSEGELSENLQVDGVKYRFLYFDCRPDSLWNE